jgi:hypothetical protein
MSKKSIIKLNEKYFSCNPVNENFEDTPEIDSDANDTDSSSDKEYTDTSNQPNKDSNVKGNSIEKKKKRSKKRSRRGSRRRTSRRTKKIPKNRSNKNKEAKEDKKTKEGFCAGNTCLTENNLKSLIKLLKKLELKK